MSEFQEQRFIGNQPKDENPITETEAALFKIGVALTSGLEMEAVLRTILDECRNVLPVDTLYVALLDRSDNTFQFTMFWDQGVYRSIEKRYNLQHSSLTSVVIERAQTLYLADFQDPTTAATYPAIRIADFPTRAYLGTPLRIGGQVIGVLSIQHLQPHRYTQGHIRLLEMIASQAAVAVENARLFATVRQELAERQRAQELLAKSEERFRLIVQNSPEIIELFDENGRLSFASGTWAAQGWPTATDVDTEEAVFKRRTEAIHYCLAHVGELRRSVFRCQSVHGEWRDYESVFQSYVRAGCIEIVCVSHDITEHIALERTLRTMNEKLELRVQERTAQLSAANAELQSMNRLKDEFLVAVRHELLTPLTSILAVADLLEIQFDGDLSGHNPHHVHTLRESSGHLLKMINDILGYTTLIAGKRLLVREQCHLIELATVALRKVAARARAKSIQIDFPTVVGEPIILSDPEAVVEILGQLLDNAVKFTPEHGQVGLAIHSHAHEDAVDLVVWDTGIGITLEAQQQLFAPFVQVDGGPARHYEGVGLGLAYVKRLVDCLTGTLHVESQVGLGSHFTVTLPRYTT